MAVVDADDYCDAAAYNYLALDVLEATDFRLSSRSIEIVDSEPFDRVGLGLFGCSFEINSLHETIFTMYFV